MEKNKTKTVTPKAERETKIGPDSATGTLRVGETKKFSGPDTGELPKWIWTAGSYLKAAREVKPGQHFESWGTFSKHRTDEPVEVFGIGKQYTMAKTVSVTGKKCHLSEGTIIYLESFFDKPKLNGGRFLVTVDEPKIRRSAFAKYEDQFKYPGEEPSDVYIYKSVVRLYIDTHLIPDYTVGYHNFALFEIDIYDQSNDSKVTEEPLRFYQKTTPGIFSANTLTELDIEIDESWRDASGHEPGKVKSFYAKIKTTIYYNEDARAGIMFTPFDEEKILSSNTESRPNWFRNKFNTEAPNGQSVTIRFNKGDEATGFFGGRDIELGKANATSYSKTTLDEYDTSKPKDALEGQEPLFKVRYDTMDVILDEYEATKSNMLAVVGDVEYTQRSGEPCKYSALEVSMPGRDTVTLFDENETTVTDNTEVAFGFVAGDEKKTVTITAKGLEIQEYQAEGENKPKCFGITAAESSMPGILLSSLLSPEAAPTSKSHEGNEEFTHSNIKDVFPMEQVHVLAPSSPGPMRESHHDQSVNISGQQLDYKHDKNCVKLELGYLYNKTYDTHAEQWLGNKFGEWTNDLADMAWICRYLFLWEDHRQSYFVPAGTCRYPNQVVKVEVLPNVEWWVNVKFSTDSPVYVKQGGSYRARPYHTNQRQKAGEDYREERAKMENPSDYSLGVEVGIKFNGSKKKKLSVNNDHPVFRTVNFFLQAYEALSKLLMSDLTKQKMAEARASKMGGRLAREMPVRIEVKRPVFSGGIHCKYTESKTQPGSIGSYVKVAARADPLLAAEGRLDLLFFAQAIPVIGTAIAGIDRAIDGINLLSFGAVNIEYHIDLVVFSDTGVEVKTFGYHSIDGLDGTGVNFEATFEIGLEAGGDIEWDMGRIEGKGVIEGKARTKFKARASLNTYNGSCPAEISFEGMEALVYIHFSFKSKKNKKNNSKPKEKPHKVPLLDPIDGVKFDLAGL